MDRKQEDDRRRRKAAVDRVNDIISKSRSAYSRGQNLRMALRYGRVVASTSYLLEIILVIFIVLGVAGVIMSLTG